METFIFDWWWRSHQSLAREGSRIFRFCVMPWKDGPEPTIKYCLGRQVDVVSKVHHNTELWTQLMVSQWNSSGISLQDSPHRISATKSKSSCQEWAQSQKISQDGLSSCQCLTTFHGDPKKMNGNANTKLSARFYVCKKIFTRKMVIPRTWIRKEVVFYSRIQTARRMGQSRRTGDDKIIRMRTPSFPCCESIVTRNAQTQRWWKMINTLLCRWGYDWHCFSHSYFC